MAKQKWYIVWAGHEPGVYDSWDECLRQISGYSGARYKGFGTRAEALSAYEEGYAGYQRRHQVAPEQQALTEVPLGRALVVDAACSGNPGVMEYRGVYLRDRSVAFQMGPFPRGTNNIGEFLAIVHPLALYSPLLGTAWPLQDAAGAYARDGAALRPHRARRALARHPPHDSPPL